jgi:hypothetical protein
LTEGVQGDARAEAEQHVAPRAEPDGTLPNVGQRSLRDPLLLLPPPAITRSSAGSRRADTGAVLGRSLRGLRDVIDRSLAEVWLAATLRDPERVALAQVIEESRLARRSTPRLGDDGA